MKNIAARSALTLVAFAVPAFASGETTLEGKWANPHRSVIVSVSRCGESLCGTVSWANARNRDKGVNPGTRVLTNLRPAGNGSYKGNAYDPKRGMGGSATVIQSSPNVMIVKGCAVMGLFCKEQRWTRVS